jgi:hypothetical protein
MSTHPFVKKYDLKVNEDTDGSEHSIVLVRTSTDCMSHSGWSMPKPIRLAPAIERQVRKYWLTDHSNSAFSALDLNCICASDAESIEKHTVNDNDAHVGEKLLFVLSCIEGVNGLSTAFTIAVCLNRLVEPVDDDEASAGADATQSA